MHAQVQLHVRIHFTTCIYPSQIMMSVLFYCQCLIKTVFGRTCYMELGFIVSTIDCENGPAMHPARYIHTYIYIYIYIYICVCVCTYIYIYIHTHTHKEVFLTSPAKSRSKRFIGIQSSGTWRECRSPVIRKIPAAADTRNLKPYEPKTWNHWNSTSGRCRDLESSDSGIGTRR